MADGRRRRAGKRATEPLGGRGERAGDALPVATGSAGLPPQETFSSQPWRLLPTRQARASGETPRGASKRARRAGGVRACERAASGRPGVRAGETVQARERTGGRPGAPTTHTPPIAPPRHPPHSPTHPPSLPDINTHTYTIVIHTITFLV